MRKLALLERESRSVFIYSLKLYQILKHKKRFEEEPPNPLIDKD